MGAEQTGNWVGVDWGDKEHAVWVLDHQGRDLAHFRVWQSAEGLRELPERLQAYGPIAGVAVETPRHLLVHVLVEAGLAVYPINPRVSHQWRKCASVAGSKDDHKDAWVLADGLRHYHSRLKRYVPDEASGRLFSQFCRDESRLVHQRSALVQRLEDLLKQYFPAAMEFISDWTTQTAWDFILQFPTAGAFASASHAKLVGFLRLHRQGLTPRWKERIATRKQATQWPNDRAVEEAHAFMAQGLARELRTLDATLKEYRKRIEALHAQEPDHEIFESLPGAGAKLAPRIASEFGVRRDRYDCGEGVQKVAGTAPVTFQSGGKREVRIRRACKKHFRNTLHQFAEQSIKQSAWARACYQQARAEGKKHATALRKVAHKWIKIIYRMWQDRKPYDEAKYLEQLKRHRSPIAFALGLLKT